MPKVLEVNLAAYHDDGKLVEYTFHIYDHETGEILTPQPLRKTVERTYIEEVEKNLSDALKNSRHEDFITLSALIRERFLPDHIQNFLNELDAPLIIKETSEHRMPWEIFYTKDFLGVTASIGRLYTGYRMPSLSLDHTPSFLFIVNPTGDLKESESEMWELIRSVQSLAPDPPHIEILEAETEKTKIETELGSGKYDVIHYSGHVDIDERNKQGFLQLAHEERLTAQQASSALETAVKFLPGKRKYPFVFINGCRSAAGGESAASGFLQGGARAVIGTSHKVSDAGSKEFAVIFYKNLFNGKSAGEAIRIARCETKNNRKDSTWASFILYGNPCISLVPQKGHAPKKEKKKELFFNNGDLNKTRLSHVGWQVMEWCLEDTKSTGGNIISTAHLFMGLTRIENGCTRSVLLENNLDPSSFRELFRALLTGESSPLPDDKTELRQNKKYYSENLKRILAIADHDAQQNEDMALEEGHLLRALLSASNNFVVNVLTTLGISIDDLKESCKNNSLEGTIIRSKRDRSYKILFSDNGDLQLKYFPEKTIKILEASIETAYKTGWKEMRTPHLFMSLISLGIISSNILIRSGIENPSDLYKYLLKAMTTGQPVIKSKKYLKITDFSENMLKILNLAIARASEEDRLIIEEHHMFLAFFYYREGIIAKLFEEAGIKPEIVRKEAEDIIFEEDDIFLEDGSLNKRMFSAPALKALDNSLNETIHTGWKEIRSPHLFMGMIGIKNSEAWHLLSQWIDDPGQVRNVFRKALNQGSPCLKVQSKLTRQLFSENTIKVVETARSIALKDNSSVIDENHLFSGLLKDNTGITWQLLNQIGFPVHEVMYVNEQLRGKGISETPFLDKIGRDMTRDAREGSLNQVVGRDKEIQRLIHTLCRIDKTNAALVGEAGVGKTAIAEGLAQKIVSDDVPDFLKGARLIEISMSSIVEGTMYRGTFEEKLKKIIKEASGNEIILFIDELHTMAGAGQTVNSALDAGNILKPALANGKIRCIGATTPKEFARSIEKDPALKRRFEIIKIDETSVDTTLDILKTQKSVFENKYKIKIEDEAIKKSIDLSVRYIPEKRLPDKARDILMNACVMVNIDRSGKYETSKDKQFAVGVNEVSKIVAQAAGIPVERLTEEEQKRLLSLEKTLKKRVVGQDRAISHVADTVLTSRTGLGVSGRPMGVFLFSGQSGVGKTSLASALCEEFFGTEKAMIRLDMSEFNEPQSISKLLGASPNYVGYGDGGQLTEPLRNRPYSLVLLDEIEKANPDIYNLFLQLFDEGRITDSQGNVIDGRNAIFIMTSNIDFSGSKIGFNQENGKDTDMLLREKLTSEHGFRKEFVNRIDKVIHFDPLSEKSINQIVELQLEDFAKDLKKQKGITLRWDDNVKQEIQKRSSCNTQGVRSVQRTIQNMIRNPLSRRLLEDVAGDEVDVNVDLRVDGANGFEFRFR